MGKKKEVKKTKELSVAISESSGRDVVEGQQPQQITPRKRGRPRKYFTEQAGAAKGEETTEHDDVAISKKAKTIHEEEADETPAEKKEDEASASGSIKEGQSETARKPPPPPPPRSRARRKSKPRKSS